MGSSICGYFTECEEVSCCESYKFRLSLLALSGLIFLAAIIVGVVWLIFEFRPAYRNRLRRSDSEQDRIEMRSFEETKYLRRYSELNPLARRHSIDN
ncbi:hypothetical protein PFISCL1PPCAC_5762 [Pristionchus fissidentatus]|uniref:Uncharacterized protein n=1 Tax=Pristionchus fissidentatus TaxID=1538716 RepID=A0AAV5V4F6_9BILA|nr:hypothetical protein PFISCL1PPCAC_5762 [Pristionchus fissidentatus]